MNRLLINILSRRWLLHVLFWVIVTTDAYLGNLRYMTSEALLKHLSFSVPVHMLQVYFNIFFLYPRLFEKGKILQYVGALLGSAMFFAFIANLLYLDAGILKDTPYRYFFFRQLYVQGLSTGAKFLRAGIYNYFLMKQMQESQRDAELKLLKSQVNPHFLFNTLNNLYSLTLKKSPQAPETVLKLSELMRYMTTVSGLDRVPLKNEIDYIRNYIDLEQLRLNPGARLDVQIQGDFSRHEITPLLLLPFVENAFKHGVESQSSDIRVELNISLQGNELYFFMLNSKVRAEQYSSFKAGTGLDNVKKRLNLIYPNRHELVIKDEIDTFTVKLFVIL